MTKDYVMNKITQLLEERNWSRYRLAKESGLSDSTLKNYLLRKSTPTVPTLMKICEAFGITMSEFFNEEETAFKELLMADQQMIAYFHKLKKEDKKRTIDYIHKLLSYSSAISDAMLTPEYDTGQMPNPTAD